MPTTIVSLRQAKNSLPQLIKRAAEGETIFIGGHGRPAAALTSALPNKRKKQLGLLAGKLIVPDDFDAPLPPEITGAFADGAE